MIHVLDTSALKWAYMHGTRHHRRLRYVISRLSGRVFVAEITMLEIVSALGSEFRAGHLSIANFHRSNSRFLRDVADGRIVVIPFQSASYIPCRDLLTLVGVRNSRNLQTQDGMVLYSARTIALDNKQKVKLLTSDRGMHKVARDFDVFRRVIDCELLPRT